MSEKTIIAVLESPEEAGYVDTQYFDYGENDEGDDVGNYDYSEASYDEAPIIETEEESTRFDNLLIQSTQEQNERKDAQVVDVNFHSFENLVRNSNEASTEEGQIDILLPQIKLNLQSTTFDQILDPDLTSVPPTSYLPDDRQPADEPSYATERTKEALNLPQQTLTALIKPGTDIEL